MAGRKPKKVYVYDIKGTYICMFENMMEFRKVYYPKDIFKRPLFIHKELGYNYEYMEDLELIAFVDKSIGRDRIKYLVAIHNSEYCKKIDNSSNTKVVQVLNLKHEVIAEFKSVRLLTKLMPHFNASTIYRQLTKEPTHSFNEEGLFFKYK